MLSDAAERLRYRLNWMHGWLIKAGHDSTDEQFAWSPQSPIRFHLWHTARVSDIDRTRLPAPREATAPAAQIWHEQDLAVRWGLDPDVLGRNQQGTDMTGENAASLEFGGREALLAYVEETFGAFEAAVGALPNERLDEAVELVTRQMSHVNRHLGSIEAIKGVLGTFGSATN